MFQDGVLVATVTELNYTSQGLRPVTSYSFFIEAFTSVGSTQSAAVVGRTLEGVPTGVAPPTLTPVSASSVSASWARPGVENGVVVRYELVLVVLGLEDSIQSESVVFAGLSFSATVSNLAPFTIYDFLVRACTNGGCGSSPPAQVQTLEAPPTFQPRPNVTALSATAALVEWAEPEEPNGMVIQYEVRRREEPFIGDGISVGNVSASTRLFMDTALQPFTVYEFSVSSYTGGGATQSLWESVTTGEAGQLTHQPTRSLF